MINCVSHMDTVNDTPQLTRLAEAIGTNLASDDFRHVWTLMKQQGFSPETLQAEFPQVVKTAKEMLRVNRQFQPASESRTRARTGRRTRSAAWLQRSTAIGQRMADLARMDPKVQAFRAKFLSGRVLMPEAVDHWLNSDTGAEAVAPLRELASALSTDYGWNVRHAARFLLTDSTPPRSAIHASELITFGGERAPRIRLEIEAWIPPAVVRDVYARLHGRYSTDRGRRRKRVRSVSPKSVALLAFVQATPGSWEQRRKAWNEANRRWTFPDRANFRRAYETASRQLDAKPYYLGA